jgi:type II restriction enzyme
MRLHLEESLKKKAHPYTLHLKSSKDLETTYEAVRAGFVALALERNRRATPFVAEARAFKALASMAETPRDLVKVKEIQDALLTAAGVSHKAANHLEDADKRAAIDGLIKNFLEPAGASFVEELVFRFLLTRGDTLGGSMRNIGGAIAQRKLTRAMIAQFRVTKGKCRWLHSETDVWADLPEDDADIELHLRGLSWQSSLGPRTLLYNLRVPLIGNNVDLCLFNCPEKTLTKATVKDPAVYLALGELKGGIDPAGADEHWKTAHTALNRINKAFGKSKLKPHTFFIGAAIEPKMASEIWELLQSGILENAANLTNDDHIVSITRWLCTI